MKYTGAICSVLVILLVVIFSRCGSNADPSLSLQQKASKIMDEGSPWGGTGNVEVLASPTGVDPAELGNLQVSFETSGPEDWAPTFFEASGADDILSSSNAIWFWTGSGTDNITLNEASVAELTGVDVTDQTVTFTFEVSASSSGGRIAGLDGTYTVRLK